MKENKCYYYLWLKIKFGIAFAQNPRHEKWDRPEVNTFTASTCALSSANINNDSSERKVIMNMILIKKITKTNHEP